jgi:hypothetical protein
MPEPPSSGHSMVWMMLQLPWMQKPVLQSAPQRVPSAAVTQAVPSHVWH